MVVRLRTVVSLDERRPGTAQLAAPARPVQPDSCAARPDPLWHLGVGCAATASRLALLLGARGGVRLGDLRELEIVITRYRAATAAQGYQGDTVANSMGDILSCAVGFWLASRFGWWKSLVLLLSVELVLLLWIRDSLLLNVVMLICPVKAIRAWQTGG